eukprot:TRINITY_DN104616_c0_g1_i1.p1 TRINITY_DN104616_c0_g1~~TRINITY_DN104616_c0_g1_i1.p1  ORF type:complete len:253 (+),score=44.32 TRINITY_DN104616_c0_g1_i1:44-760(+)
MNINRIANKITKSYLMDPYSMLMHYKRAFKLLKEMQKNRAKILILGNKNQFGIDWKGRFEGVEFDTGVVDAKIISSAPKHYDMILCLDPVLYCRSLFRLSLPVMMCATTREITEHPEILDVTDYLLPSPTRRHDAALRQLIAGQVLPDEKTKETGSASDGMPETGASAREASPGAGRKEALDVNADTARTATKPKADAEVSSTKAAPASGSRAMDAATEQRRIWQSEKLRHQKVHSTR